MQGILNALKDGNMSIPTYFAQAELLWCELLEDIDDIDIEELAVRLDMNQSRFESICGERYLGKKIMGLSSISHFYTAGDGWVDGNGYRAYKLCKAFAKSSCSTEVKSAVREAAAMYAVDEHC